MTEQELKVILASAYCLNAIKGGNKLTNDLLAYAFKQYFGIDVQSLGAYCSLNGDKALSEITDILNYKTSYKRRLN